MSQLPTPPIEDTLPHVRRRERETGVKLLFTVEELAKLAGVSAKTIRREQAKGKMPTRQFWGPTRQYLYYVPDTEKWLAGSRFSSKGGSGGRW